MLHWTLPRQSHRMPGGRTAAVLLATLVWALAAPAAAGDSLLRFVAFGDLQDESPAGRARDRELVARINALDPAFSIYIGDIKGGSGPCTDALYDEVRSILDGHAAPLVYTPGDNEWTDCWRRSAGGHDPRERKAAVIERFTAPGESLGQRTMALAQQEGQRENARWQTQGVVFATLHITGSNNNLRQDRAAQAEHRARSAANVRWLRAAFATAREADARAVVLALHANPQWDAPWWSPTGFDDFRAALAEEAGRFDGPVLVIHGDTHSFRLDRPFDAAPNVVRLEVFGPPARGAVVVDVDPSLPGVFRVSPLALD
jgi:hypothetical protein